MAKETQTYLDLHGLFYQTFIANLHKVLRPETYFEIGSLNGDTLKLAQCASVCVDPMFQITSDIIGQKPSCHMFQMGSDVFFRRHNPSTIFGQPIQMAFLDGMHLFEFLLRDFANTEKHCAKNSVIILHDCVPGDPYVCVRSPDNPLRNRSQRSGYWTGDVWKVLPALNAWRKDLQILVTDAPPTGLVIISNLDPGNTVIEDNYSKIIGELAKIDLSDYGVGKLHEECRIIPTSNLMTIEDLAPYFWL
jgi:hypothetical protein